MPVPSPTTLCLYEGQQYPGSTRPEPLTFSNNLQTFQFKPAHRVILGVIQ